MTLKQRALKVLTKDGLLALGKLFDLKVAAKMPVDELVRTLSGSKRATLDRIAPALSAERLKERCNAIEPPVAGRKKQDYVDALVQAATGAQPESDRTLADGPFRRLDEPGRLLLHLEGLARASLRTLSRKASTGEASAAPAGS